MKADFSERLAAIPWADYQTAYGNAAGPHRFKTADGRAAERWGSIAEQLTALASPVHETAMHASHHLWCSLCHQHAYVSSAAVPALPFILEILDEANEKLTVEILDIVTGFAACSRHTGGPAANWLGERRNQLRAQHARFRALAKHQDQDVADWAQRVLEELELVPST